MQIASRARVNLFGVELARQFRSLANTAGIKKMQDRGGGLAVPVHAQEAVPKRVEGDCGWFALEPFQLRVRFAQAFDADLQQKVRIGFYPAVRSGLDLISDLLPKALLLMAEVIEHQRPHAGSTYIEADDQAGVMRQASL